jgi:hypothetical protein
VIGRAGEIILARTFLIALNGNRKSVTALATSRWGRPDCLRRAMRLLLQAKRIDLLHRSISGRELVNINENTSAGSAALR